MLRRVYTTSMSGSCVLFYKLSRIPVNKFRSKICTVNTIPRTMSAKWHLSVCISPLLLINHGKTLLHFSHVVTKFILYCNINVSVLNMNLLIHKDFLQVLPLFSTCTSINAGRTVLILSLTDTFRPE